MKILHTNPPKPNRLHSSARKSNKSRKYFDKTIDLIKTSYFPVELTERHAAIIIKGGNIIGFGVNSLKAHPMVLEPVLRGKSDRTMAITMYGSPTSLLTLHAEMVAIRNCRNKESLRGATMFVARYSPFHGEMLSCPCQSCEYYLKKYGIQRVVYSTQTGEWYESTIQSA